MTDWATRAGNVWKDDSLNFIYNMEVMPFETAGNFDSGAGIGTDPGCSPRMHMNRSTSEWYLQEFLRNGLANQGEVRIDDPVSAVEEEDSHEEVDKLDVRESNGHDLLTDTASLNVPLRTANGGPLAHGDSLAHEDSLAREDSLVYGDSLTHGDPLAYGDSLTHGDQLAHPVLTESLNPLFSGLQKFPCSGTSSSLDPQRLREELERACAMVAMKNTRDNLGSSARGLALSADLPGTLWPQGAEPSYLPSGGPAGIPALPPKPTGQAPASKKKNTSESSREQTEDEDGENEHSLEVGNSKREKRMQSNRESARRSRSRKLFQLNELKTQCDKLQLENKKLANNIVDLNQKVEKITVDNRLWRSAVASLALKVSVAKGMVDGLINPTQSTSDLNKTLMQSLRTDSVYMPRGAYYVPPHPSTNDFLIPGHLGGVSSSVHSSYVGPVGMSLTLPGPSRAYNGTTGKIGRTPSMQQIATLQHETKRVRGGATATWAPNRATLLDNPVAGTYPVDPANFGR